MDDPEQTPVLVDRFGQQPPEIMSELHSMLRIYSIDAQELFFKWESYCIKMLPEELKLDLDTIRNFKKDVQSQLEKEMRGKARQHQAGPAAAMRTPRAKPTDGFGMLDELTGSVGRSTIKRKLDRAPYDTPVRSTRNFEASSPGMPPSSPLPIRTPLKREQPEASTPFSQRTNAGETTEILNPHLPKPTLPLDTSYESRVRFLFNMELRNFSYRPMYQKLMEASEVTDERIDEFAALIQETYQIRDSELGDPSVASPSEIVAIGRIVSDSLEGRLNPHSVMLESSRMTAAGARTPLNLSRLPSFALFPGQIVGVRGTNASGDYFSVSELLHPPPLPPISSTPSEIAETNTLLSAGPLSVFIASGPYTPDDNLDFSALSAIVDRAAAARPDVLLLTGPFIDATHPLVASGDFDLPTAADPDTATVDDLFRERITPLLRTLPHTLILLVPSLRDAVSKHLAYPQAPLARKSLGLPSNVRCLPNPSMLTLSGTTFAVSTADILFHLSRAETTRAPQPANPPARLTAHVLAQRSFYPLFPAARAEELPVGVGGVSVDVAHSRLFDIVGGTPDVVVLPSALAGFAKVVEGVVAVNPGQASKRRGAGTWVEMYIGERVVGEDERGEEALAHKVYERARVEVVRV